MSPTFHSQIKTEVLLLLEEVIHDELAHEVRVERVINDLGASKLQENVRVRWGQLWASGFGHCSLQVGKCLSRLLL